MFDIEKWVETVKFCGFRAKAIEKEAGISAGYLSKIFTGKVKNPTVKTIVLVNEAIKKMERCRIS